MAYNFLPGMFGGAREHASVTFRSDNDKLKFGYLDFQDGPIPEHGVNGTTIEEVVLALIERLEALNQAPYACRENSVAITKLQEAVFWLNERTRKRIARNVEGTLTP